ncbi:hypothetical protein DFP73DRAFT_523833 [Morchella snyderi]|nr:hypothetical protein DFP73DRAFT_523833 [Morchella snyderi]
MHSHHLLPALLLLLPAAALAQPAIPYPLPWQDVQQPAPPPPQQQPASTHDLLLPIVHERLQKPKEWATNGPTPEGEMDVSDEDLEFLTPKSHVTFGRDDNSIRQWFSPLGSTFKTFMDSMKTRNAEARAEQQAAEEEEEEEAEEGEGGGGVQRRAIPSMLSKGKKTQPEPEPEPAAEPEPAPEPEQQAAEDEIDSLELSEVAITNEEFDQLFKDYASRYERAQTFQGLQGHLDTILLPGSGSAVESKPWKQRRPGRRLARRNGGSGGGSGSGSGGGGGSSGATPSYLWTPESEKVGVRPVSSINPDIFNRIAAEYRFGQDPTSINQEEINVVGMGAAGKQQAQRGAGGSKGKAAGGAKGKQVRV